MSIIKCAGCDIEHEDYNWKHTTYDFEDGERTGWFCSKYFKSKSYEWIPERIKQDRKKYAKDLIQPFRGGEPNKEFVKEYPRESKDYFTDKQIKKAKVLRV